MAVARTTSGFVDVDLSTPRLSRVALVPPSVGTAAGLSSQTCPQVCPVSALPVTPLNTSPVPVQLHPPTSGGADPTMINGNSGVVVSSSSLPVGTNASLGPPVQISLDTTVMSQCHPPVDVQVGATQNCHGALDPRHTGGVDGEIGLPPPSGHAPVSASLSCISNTDRRVLLITSAAARQAFWDYGQSKCCYGSSPAKEMTGEELQPLNTYRYSLETFTESRSCEWIMEHYTGQPTDSADVGCAAPQPWEIPVIVPEMFKDRSQKMKVPHTSSVKVCSQCKGMGKNTCLRCHATGRIQCMWCNGTGRRLQMEMCQQCYGSGTESCRMCHSAHSENCATCGGKGQILIYMQLTVTWKNNEYHYISDHNSEFSSDLLKTVHGERILTEEQPSVSPLENFPDSSITWASQNALEQHRLQFSSSCRVLRQKQSVELLPLTKVQYNWKGKRLNYFVYGKENKVYVQNYPQKCCCVVM